MEQKKSLALVSLGFALTAILALAFTIASTLFLGNTIEALGGDSVSVSKLAAGARNMRVVLLILGVAALGVSAVFIVLIPMQFKRVLSESFFGIESGLQNVSDAGDNILSSTEPLAERTSEQASAVEEIASAMEQISAMTQQSAGNADTARELAEETSTVAASCSSHMEEMSIAIGQVQEVSEKTKGIVKGIDEIAFQTNLLALNAAVEAARAGDAGKGFAVVAEEVRNLAQRAAEAARNTSSMIDDSNTKITEAMNKVFEVIDEFSKVAESAQKVTGLVTEISGASSEQSRGIKEISISVSQLEKLTQQNAEASETSAMAATQLQEYMASLLEAFQEMNSWSHHANGAPDALPAGRQSYETYHVTSARGNHATDHALAPGNQDIYRDL